MFRSSYLIAILVVAVSAGLVSAAGQLKPLVERDGVWSRDAGGFVAKEQMVEELAAARVVVLGEVHDNREHHQRRAALVDEIVDRRAKSTNGEATRPAAVFEHFNAEKDAVLAELTRGPNAKPSGPSLDKFLDRVDWDVSGWPGRDTFGPLFEAVLTAGLAIYPGDPRPGLMKDAARNGPSAVPSQDRTRLALDTPLGDAQERASLEEIHDAHCKMMPIKSLQSVAFAQRLRDAMLADATLRARDAHGAAILFTGNNHVRRDRGVPWYLERRGAADVVTVQFLEVSAEETDPNAALIRSPEGKPVADFVVFTPRIARPDPCEKLRRHFEKKKG